MRTTSLLGEKFVELVGARRRDRPDRRRRHHPARADRAGRGGRGGARRAVDAPQRRRRRPDPDDRHRAEQRAHRQRAGDPGAARRRRLARRRAGRPQGRDHPRARRDQPALGHAERAQGPDPDGARRPRARPARSWRPSAAGSWTCCRPSTGSPAWPPTWSTAAGTTCSPTSSCCARSCAKLVRVRPGPAELAGDPAARFPFTDAAVDAFAGDYANLYVRADLDLSDVLENLARSNQPFPGPDGPLACLPPTAQLLGPLLGPTRSQEPPFPLLGRGADPAARARRGRGHSRHRLAGARGRTHPCPRTDPRRRSARRPPRRWRMITRVVRWQLAALLVLSRRRRRLRGVPLRGLRRRSSAPRPTRCGCSWRSPGGIFTGADVTYRGVSVGRVGPLTLTPDGVEVQLDIDNERARRSPPTSTSRCATSPRSASSTST